MQKKLIIVIFSVFIVSNLYSQKVLTLEDAMNVALNNSPDIITSELNMTIDQENLNAREAATKALMKFELTPLYYNQSRVFNDFYSTWNTSETKRIYGNFTISQPVKLTDARITLNNNLQYQDSYSEFTNTNTKGFNNNLYIDFSQPLFTYNKLKMELEQLRRSLETSTLNYAIQRLYLERQVSQYFYAVYQRKMALEIAEEEYKNQQASHEIISSKVEGGLLAQEEFLQSEINLASSESSLYSAQVDLENAKDQFKQYIGMPLSEDFDIFTNIDFQQVDVDIEKAIQNGLETRMELQQREISLKNSRDQLTVAKATNEFAGELGLSLGLAGENENFGNIYQNPTRSPEVQLTLNIPIWDWGERKSRIKAAEAMIKIEEINLRDEKVNVELGIRQSYRSLLNLGRQIEIERQNEKNAQLTYEINLERYKNGDLTSMDLGRYQNQLSTSKMNLANSLINYKLELLNMKIQSLWDFENNISFVPKEFQNNLNQTNN